MEGCVGKVHVKGKNIFHPVFTPGSEGIAARGHGQKTLKGKLVKAFWEKGLVFVFNKVPKDRPGRKYTIVPAQGEAHGGDRLCGGIHRVGDIFVKGFVQQDLSVSDDLYGVHAQRGVFQEPA